MQNILTIDVEDWFHILEVEATPSVHGWDQLESRVEKNFLRLLDEIDSAEVTATCFFLGWVAERFPNLVKEAVRRGHEIASHGYAHQLVYSQSPEEFAKDIERSKQVLEDVSGKPVTGYRAPGFSITRDTEWAFEKIAAAGFKYDSSVFPAKRGHGGIEDGELAPYWMETDAGPLLEIPVTVIPLLGQRVCAFGGGYLRLAPYALISKLSEATHHKLALAMEYAAKPPAEQLVEAKVYFDFYGQVDIEVWAPVYCVCAFLCMQNWHRF